MYTEFEIRELRLTMPRHRQMVERFLADNGLRLDPVDYYAGVFALDGEELLAGGGLSGNVIKCIAVSSELRDEGMSNRLISHLISVAHERGCQNVKVFTKPLNRAVFESLGFRLLAEAPKAILMETGTQGIEDYCRYLRSLQREGRSGVIVMNANPFTLGHRYLIEQAMQKVAHLFVIAVKEEVSMFSCQERLFMIRQGCADLPRVTVCEGSDYAISAATFPTYFLKELSEASETQMRLDLDLFRRHIMPALNATVRFVGSEPTDALTSRYNELMREMLPQVETIERKTHDGTVISASAVRKALDEGSMKRALPLVPTTTVPYLIVQLAIRALTLELDTTPKPGLVDRHDNGAHKDMDYDLMARSIRALRPYFVQVATTPFEKPLQYVHDLQAIGIEAEKAMLAATGGVNTHKGAFFSMGITIAAKTQGAASLQLGIKKIAGLFPMAKGTHGSEAVNRYQIKGALANAAEGYPQLFADWLPFYQSVKEQPYALHKTLLRIMATLDDTNIYHRTDADTALWVKQLSKEVLMDFSVEKLEAMNRDFIIHNISPGGCADMLALTVFIDSLDYETAGLRDYEEDIPRSPEDSKSRSQNI